jgi:hypothetical protein
VERRREEIGRRDWTCGRDWRVWLEGLTSLGGL